MKSAFLSSPLSIHHVVGALSLISYIFTKGISPFVIIRSDEDSQSPFLSKPRVAAAEHEAGDTGHTTAGLHLNTFQVGVCWWGSSASQCNQEEEYFLHHCPKSEGMGGTNCSKDFTSEGI